MDNEDQSRDHMTSGARCEVSPIVWFQKTTTWSSDKPYDFLKHRMIIGKIRSPSGSPELKLLLSPHSIKSGGVVYQRFCVHHLIESQVFEVFVNSDILQKYKLKNWLMVGWRCSDILQKYKFKN